MSKFKFIELDKSVLPKTKGKKIDGHRFYQIDGKNYPSITTVLGIQKTKELQKWRDSIGNDVANWEMGRAARRGKATHTLVEQYLKGETPSERSVLPLGLFRLLKPYVDQINNIHALETIMYSKKLTVAGQVDCIAEYKGKLSVVDFKTSTKQRDEDYNYGNFLQCSAYAKMFEEIYPDKKIEQTVVLAACEDGFVQEWIHGPESIAKHQELFYKHTKEFFERNSINS